MPTSDHATLELMRRNAKHECDTQRPGPYGPFAAALKPGQRGDQGATNLVNKSPPILGELANYFLGLDARKLATCWVACITDQCVGTDIGVGDMARALIVVAERLHGVVWTEPLRVPCPPAALDGAGPMPFKIEVTAPPMTAKEAAKHPQHVRDALETLKTAPMGWRWFRWENCPKNADERKGAIRLTNSRPRWG